MSERSFPSIFAGMLSPFLIWAGHFGAVYAINTVICARGLDRETLWGVSPAPVAVTVATLAALLCVAAVAVWAARDTGPADPDLRRFGRWLRMAGAGVAFVAILWSGLPALQLPACA
ncbi:hypothetical protein VY88_10645 [Azospirillum thiophilum]|uniref:Uncharacterized protein n=1 Tax=Azospirillum thiophilum TaxID=528244 RepID=A0AAC8ZT42_9PROT|nr:hypothetical protein [Azospirillum thiophilum]ALG69907.1 hypothetical protein AL072_02065 [Azospirillum thiophilum]KJR66407.1 hypothetical protein VY88_10645 [Azospirillum thiophilum]